MLAALRQRPFTVQALIVAVAASASLLVGAHIFEAIGYLPCPLCLDQRQAHWVALAVAGAGLGAHFLFRARLAAAAAVGAAAMVYLFSAGLAFFHTGVEFKFWPGPATCSGQASAITDASVLETALVEKPKGPSCIDAQWRFLGISMAGYNLLASAGLFARTLAAAVSAARAAHDARRPGPGRAGAT